MRAFRFRLFALTLGIAVIFDYGSTHQWDRTPADVLLVIAAFTTVLRGGSVAGVLAVAVFQIITVVLRSPWYSNHWLFLGMVSAGLLMAAGVALKRTGGRLDAATLEEVFAPVGRWALLALYFFVVFHKLNPDFFRPESSAVGSFLNRYTQLFGRWTPDSVVTVAAIGTIAVETAIPVLLSVRVTRRWGLLLGIPFHCALALTPGGRFYDFSAVVLALYVLFLPAASVGWIRQTIRMRVGTARLPEGGRTWQFFWALLAALPAYLVFHFTPPGKLATGNPFMAVWLAYAAVYAWGVVPGIVRGVDGRLGFRIRPVWLWCVPAVVVFNGLNPYLGLKTETSFAMFSNLQTENGRSNHWLVPASIQVFDFQRECAEILETDHPRLVEFVEEKRLITFFELCCVAQDYPGGAVRFRYRGQEHALQNIGQNNGLLPKPNPLLKRYLRFREFFADGSSGNWH